MSYNPLFHYLFLCSNCPRFYRWESFQAGSYVLSICSHYLSTFLEHHKMFQSSWYTFPAPAPESIIFPRISFCTEWYLETKIRMLGCTTATGVQLLVDPLRRQEYDIDVCVSVYILTQTYLYVCLLAYLSTFLLTTYLPNLCMLSVHECTLIPSIPISHFQDISMFPLSMFLILLSNSEKSNFQYPQDSYLLLNPRIYKKQFQNCKPMTLGKRNLFIKVEYFN